MLRALGIAVALLSTQANAYDRARLPVAVAVAQADVIAVATVTEVLPQTRFTTSLRVSIDKTLLGSLTGSHRIELDTGQWAVGDRLVVHLVQRGGTWTALLDGAEAYSPKVEATRVAQIAHRPAWPDPVAGLSSVLVTETHEIGVADHLNAWVIVKNHADRPQTFSYREKPVAAHTYWTLTVTRDGVPIAPRPHPHVPRAEADAHFAAHGHVFDLEVAPGDTFALPLTRINSAEPGWGYKQRLGFRYWPMAQPGTYVVSAQDHGFAGRPALATPAVTVVVR